MRLRGGRGWGGLNIWAVGGPPRVLFKGGDSGGLTFDQRPTLTTPMNILLVTPTPYWIIDTLSHSLTTSNYDGLLSSIHLRWKRSDERTDRISDFFYCTGHKYWHSFKQLISNHESCCVFGWTGTSTQAAADGVPPKPVQRFPEHRARIDGRESW